MSYRIHSILADDFDTTTVRIEKSQMQKLGISDGDTVKITGTKSSGAICRPIDDGFKLPSDSDIIYASKNATILPQLRPSNFVAESITDYGGSGLIPVTLEKICDGASAASKVSLMPLSSGTNTGNFDKNKLNKAIVCKGNRFRFRDSDPRKNFGFLVTGVEPSDYSQITTCTEIEFVPTDPNVIHSSHGVFKLERLQNVIPIVYEATLENVTVTIPSLEIFDTGIRFHVYIKGSYGDKIFQNGSTSIAATLHDDAGNMCALANHGRGGSSSPVGFEYDYEFHGKPLPSETKQLTITVKEIIIQEQFPRPSDDIMKPNRMMKGTREEYARIKKFPSFFIISGPWQVTFPLNGKYT